MILYRDNFWNASFSQNSHLNTCCGKNSELLFSIFSVNVCTQYLLTNIENKMSEKFHKKIWGERGTTAMSLFHKNCSQEPLSKLLPQLLRIRDITAQKMAILRNSKYVFISYSDYILDTRGIF